MSALAP
jgi:hypothetical protein